MSDPAIQMPVSIAKGLAKAQIYARGVDKKGENRQGGGYFYATSEDIIVEARRALAEGGGIFFSSVGWDYEPIAESGPARTKTDGAKTKTLATATARVIVRYRLISIDTGETYCDTASAPVVPDFGRPDDKASFGTLTECIAYTLRGILNLPRGVEGAIDMNQRDDSGFVPADQRDDGRDPEPDRRPPSDRPSDSGPRDSGPRDSGPRASSAGDRAAEAQTGVPQHRGQPGFDPAHVALCDQIESEARAIQGDPADLYDRAAAAKLPIPLARRAFFAVLCAAARNAPDLDVLGGWEDLAHKISAESFKWESLGEALKDAFDGADERLRGKAA